MEPYKFLLGVAGITALLASYPVLAQAIVPGDGTTGSPGTSAHGMPIRVCPYKNVILRPGMSSDEVKTLQSILAQDTTIYPQGIASGYYGNLTTEAVKRLQRRAGLPETGIVDEDTREYVFPCFTIRVTSPNGGENWRVGETATITWTLEAPYILMNPQIRGTEGRLEEHTLAPTSVAPPANAIRPFLQNLSIDLIRYDGPEVMVYPAPVYYHIGSASLYGERSYSWTIPSSIKDSKMYKVRIGLWRNVPNPFECKTRPCPLVPESNAFPIQWQGSFWDESDDYFAISGGPIVTPAPSVTPVPVPDQGKLIALRAQLMQALESIQKAINILNELIGVQPTTFRSPTTY